MYCIETIKRLDERSGGFGDFLVGFTQDLAPRDKVLRSYELMARYVMPHFQGSLAGLHTSNQRARSRADTTRESMAQALDRARQAYQERRGGAR
jgi:limonene 1,2-monooxygenase